MNLKKIKEIETETLEYKGNIGLSIFFSIFVFKLLAAFRHSRAKKVQKLPSPDVDASLENFPFYEYFL